ncbi:hypothetical protein PtA15_8A687 [Puccinia triticina]|uniref:Uncharacterized protein n=1 Tax=Puccinia triticina TaxID=208348 RepID=A0ABY7CR80_9BASI|nr:uncharacterized protein PtA15_8A687 [Puccinia triticina]WAQ87781.1 hypothetical protein PtA15_8A687 [Puccinia triticina]
MANHTPLYDAYQNSTDIKQMKEPVRTSSAEQRHRFWHLILYSHVQQQLDVKAITGTY